MSLYAIPPGADFAPAFAAGFRARTSHLAPEAVGRTLVLVNTRRAGRAIEEALADAALAAGGPALLPRIALLSELGADALAEPELPPALDPMRRRLHLVRLVESYLTATEGGAALAAAPDLADALGRLFDELQEEGVDADALDHAVPPEMAHHWQRTLEFADLVRRVWPAIRAEAEGGALDPKARQRAVIERLIQRWAEAPPDHPVIAAGSTGSVASTAELLVAIARMPQGSVVLPGFDRTLADDIWDGLGADHPMGPFRRVFGALALRPADARAWAEEPAPGARHRLITEALRPAPVTDAWVEAAAALEADALAATGPMTLVTAENQRVEAGAIALAIRRGLENPKTRIALITPDATLARRVAAELQRFDIEPDDSLGKPLSESPAGVFFRLIGRVAAAGALPVEIAALMNHPMMRPGLARGAHRRHARRYEKKVLRERPEPDRPAGRLPRWPDASADQAAWLSAIETALAPLAMALEGGTLARIVAAHRAAADALSRETPEAAALVAGGEDGEALNRLLTRIEAAADAYGEGHAAHWPALFANLMAGETLRPDPARPHPRVAIWGTMEARVQAADLVILGGLNEGTWPPVPAPDPWLSRPMREILGLAPPERAIGLSAHDFLQAAAKPEVVMTRATRIDGTPTVPSRWLMRLENLLGGIGGRVALDAMRQRGEALCETVRLVHRPGHAVPPAPRPAPRPDPAARPDHLSVTQIETLIRDAYAVYARYILRLKPFDPLGRPANYLDRGHVMHTIVERFIEATEPDLPPDAEAEALLVRIAEDVLAAEIPWPDTRRVWRGRVTRFAPWFVDREADRRMTAATRKLEVKGTMPLAVAGRPFTIRARADRIDIEPDGSAAIFDYKAGVPPTKNKVSAGFAHQLPLQAEMLLAGGFEDTEATRVRLGAYIGLTGSKEGGVEVTVDDLMENRAIYRERLVALLARYADRATPYLSRGRVEKTTDFGDYDHLARRREWDAIDE